MLTPLFAIVLDASAARAAARSSQVDPLDALSAFDGDWLCEAKRVGLLMPLAELPTQPASDGPNGAHGYVRARRVLKHRGDTGRSRNRSHLTIRTKLHCKPQRAILSES